ncbi:MAG: DUF819 family protein [Bacilli bacterium]|nr:DUF819 family protein [Bacilli bacterium]
MKCPRCGNEINESIEDTCSFCGAKINVEKDSYNSKPISSDWVEKWKHKRLWSSYVVVSLAILVYLGSIAFCVWGIIDTFARNTYEGLIFFELLFMTLYLFLLSAAIPKIVIRYLKKRSLVKEIHGYTVLVYISGGNVFLVCDDKLLALEKDRVYSDDGVKDEPLIGELPDRTKIRVEFDSISIRIVEEENNTK